MSSLHAELDSTEQLRSSPIDGYASPAPQLTPPEQKYRRVNFPRKLLLSQSVERSAGATACQNEENVFGTDPLRLSQTENTSEGPDAVFQSRVSKPTSNSSVEGATSGKRGASDDWTDGEAEPNMTESRQSTALTSPQTSSDGSPFLTLLARDHGPLGNVSSSTSFASTLTSLESLMPKLRHRYELELDVIRGQVAERDLAIERLRARLRPKRSKHAH